MAELKREHKRQVGGSVRRSAARGLLLTSAFLLQSCFGKVEWNPIEVNFVKQLPFPARGQLDVLFVIDNSPSMHDKQVLLRNAVPRMIEQLASPACVNLTTGEKSANPGLCPEGTAVEFPPLRDMHIGVISSSLGGHGTQNCARGVPQWNFDDRGHLIPTMREGISTPDGLGFLRWTGGTDKNAPATNVSLLTSNLQEQVDAVGETGCGFEAALEAWYRFLIDPQPPETIVIDESSRAQSTGIDQIVLAQREAFLRPQSVVAIVTLSDENDCSMMDGGTYYESASFGYLLAETSQTMRAATAECENDPNDECCFSCLQKASPPQGCKASAQVCNSFPEKLAPELDRAGVRCFDNKRRFGVDLLYPIERYVSALTKTEIIDARTGKTVANPLLTGAGVANKGTLRDPDLVFFAPIVGIPWQDIASEESLATGSTTLEYLSPTELREATVSVDGRMVDRWEIILGNPRESTPPLDPFMVESIAARPTGKAHPIVPTETVQPAESVRAQANNINGHEFNNMIEFPDGEPAADDLQYSCIFELEQPKLDCAADNIFCDCSDEPNKNRPVCQRPGTIGSVSTSQYFGKAYPGTRILKVAREIGDRAIVASICPKVPTGNPSNPNYGFNPALKALVEPVQNTYLGVCFEPALPLSEQGRMLCSVLEAKPRAVGDAALNCSAPGRSNASEEMQTTLRNELRSKGLCAEESCLNYEMCALSELADDARQQCLLDPADALDFNSTGYCYIDPASRNEAGAYVAGGDPVLLNQVVAHCRSGKQRMVRLVGEDTPAAGAAAFVVCVGDAARELNALNTQQ